MIIRMALADSRFERFRPRCGGATSGAAFPNGQQSSVLDGFQFLPRRSL